MNFVNFVILSSFIILGLGILGMIVDFFVEVIRIVKEK